MKYLIIMILTIILILNPFLAFSGQLQDEIIRLVPEYSNIKETGDNTGPQVDRILKNVGLAPGNPWCMALVYTVNKEASNNIGAKTVLPATGASAGYWVYANKRKLTFKVTTAKQVMLGAKLNPGATGIFKRGPFRTDGTFPGHANIIIKQIDSGAMYSLDGNTGTKSEWNGEGSAYKVRKLGVPSLLFMGSIDVR